MRFPDGRLQDLSVFSAAAKNSLQFTHTVTFSHSLDNVCAEPNASDSRYLDGLHKMYSRHQDFPRTQPRDMVRSIDALQRNSDTRTT